MHEFVTFLMSLDLSDYLILMTVPVAAWFTLSYGIGSPWYTHPLGVITLLTALSVCGLLVLIVYAVIAGERIPEPVRVLVALALFVSYLAKVVILHVERRRGRIARRHRSSGATHSTPGEGVKDD